MEAPSAEAEQPTWHTHSHTHMVTQTQLQGDGSSLVNQLFNTDTKSYTNACTHHVHMQECK